MTPVTENHLAELFGRQHQLEMLSRLPADDRGEEYEPNVAAILVRLPLSIHEAAKKAAKGEGLFLNSFCIAAIEHAIAACEVPA